VAAFDGALLVVTMPDNGDRIGAALQRTGAEVRAAADLEAATAAAFAWSQPGGVVLLSPAAPSFGRFRDYRDRSAAFRAAMEACRE
jgi:UDP-N-acetylmuramoylalanine--D-glutamate ligase